MSTRRYHHHAAAAAEVHKQQLQRSQSGSNSAYEEDLLDSEVHSPEDIVLVPLPAMSHSPSHTQSTTGQTDDDEEMAILDEDGSDALDGDGYAGMEDQQQVDESSEEEEHADDDESEDDEIEYESDGEAEAVKAEMQALLANVPALQGHYDLVDRLGEGTFSSVYKAIDIHHKAYDNSDWGQAPPRSSSGTVYVALKRIYVTSSPIRILNELDILHDLRSGNNVAYLISAMRHEDQVIAVMPYNRHQDFRSYYRTATLPLLRSYFASLFRALASTHHLAIIHRDVKPANFLYDTVRATGVLCDYGLAEKIGGDGWFDWKAQCCHSLPSPSFGGLVGRAKSNKRVERLAPGHAPGFASGLHGARLVAPISLLEQAMQQEKDWEEMKSEWMRKQDAGDADIISVEELRAKKPWVVRGDVKDDLKMRWKEQQSWYKSWRPVEPSSSSSSSSSKQQQPGYLADDKDRRSSVRANRAGTRGFRAPEVLLKCPDQTVALDIWSAGIILLCFLTKRFPFFNSNDDTEALAEITAIFGRRKLEKCAAMHNRTFKTDIPDFESPRFSTLHSLVKSLCPSIVVHNSPDPYGKIPSSTEQDKAWYQNSELYQAVDLMKRCLELDLTKRWTAEELLEHDFFNGEFDLGKGQVGPRQPHHR